MNKKENSSIFETALYNFEQTAERLGLEEAMAAKLSEPKEKIEVTINPILSNGTISHVKAFIIRHNDALGPAKGGIRMSETVSSEDITGLAMEMTWKTSLIGVPFGGGKSGICCDISKLPGNSKEVIIRSFTRSLRRHIGPEIYVPAPDMGTNEQDMGHIRDCISYSEGMSITSGCFVTGKPVILGGIVGRREATGKGVVYSALAACKKLGVNIEGAKVAVQGFGNVGSVAACAISDLGAKVVAVSDVTSGIANVSGIDIKGLCRHIKETGTVKGFEDSDEITNEDLLVVDCDILIPAATQSVITADNAGKIKARIIAEGANAPTTPQADEILNKRQVFVIPDILCNAGGVFVSYLEYTQETQREQMTFEQVEKRLSQRMNEKFKEVYQYSKDENLSMRDSAMNIAVGGVVEAVYARGFLP